MRTRTLLAVVVTLAAALVLPPAVRAEDPVPVGPAFQVHTSTEIYQRYPVVATTADEGFLVVWDTLVLSPELTADVDARRFDAFGSPVGGDVRLPASSTLAGLPRVASAPLAPPVVAWTAFELDTDVRAMRLGPDLAPLGPEIVVTASTAGYEQASSVAVGADGGFVVVWTAVGAAGGHDSGYGLRALRYDPSGAPLAADLQVDPFTTGTAGDSRIGMDAAGNFVVVWTHLATARGGTTFDAYGRVFAADGSPSTGAFPVASAEESTASAVGVRPDGDFLVVWEDRSLGAKRVVASRWSSGGALLGAELQVNLDTGASVDSASVALDGDGDAVVVWRRLLSGSEVDHSIRLRRFDWSEGPVGSELIVDGQADGNPSRPDVASTVGGDFLVAWQKDLPGPDPRILARAYRLTSDLGGRVFLDENGDGLEGPAFLEPGVEGIPVHLVREATGEIVASTETDAEGRYAFLPRVGSWVVAFEVSDVTAFSPAGVGGDETIDSDADPATGRTAPLDVVAPASAVLDVDAGLLFGLGDRVWLDLDRNGIQDGGEPGVEGVVVRARAADGGLLATDSTDAAGRFLLDVPLGDVFLEVEAPAGFAFTERDAGPDDAVDSDVSASGRTVVFPFAPGERRWDAGLVSTTAQLGDRVWLDENGNGLQDGDEPGVAGVLVTLRDVAEPPFFTDRGDDPTATTDGNGFFSFSVEPGTWALEFTLPADHAFVVRDAGTDDAIDSDVDPFFGTTPPITVGAGAVDSTWDAGIEPAVLFADGFESGDLGPWNPVGR